MTVPHAFSTLAANVLMMALALAPASAADTSAPAAGHADAPERIALPAGIALTYEIFLSGIRVASVDVRSRFEDGTYAFEADTRSRGPIDALIGFRSKAVTVGVRAGEAFAPVTHTADNLWQGEPRHVVETFAPDGAVLAETVPDAAGDKREPVEPAARTGAVDPITAGLLMTLGGAHEAGCDRSELVFDGRRLYRLSLTPLEADGTDRSTDPGRWTCHIFYERLGGRSADPWWPSKDTPKEARVTFERREPNAPPLATRIVAWAGPARLAIVLKSTDVEP